MPVRNRTAPVGVLHLLLEGERARVRLPAGEGRLELLGEVRAHVQPAVPRASAEPLDRPTDREADTERGDVERDDAGRLVAVEDHVRAHLVRPAHDRLDVLDLPRLVEDVADRDEQRALVDPLDDLLVRLADDDFEIRLRLVEVADGREVATLVDDAVARRIDRAEARERDRFGDSHVLVHHRRSRRRADDTADLVADRPRRLPPALGPGADPALLPHAAELGQTLRRLARHRAERVADEVGRVLEDRELAPVVD